MGHEDYNNICQYLGSLAQYLEGEPSDILAHKEKRYTVGECGIIISFYDHVSHQTVDIPSICNQLILEEIKLTDVGIQFCNFIIAEEKVMEDGIGYIATLSEAVSSQVIHNRYPQYLPDVPAGIIYHEQAFNWVWEFVFNGEVSQTKWLDLRYLLAILPKIGLAVLAKKILVEIALLYRINHGSLVSIISKIDEITVHLE